MDRTINDAAAHALALRWDEVFDHAASEYASLLKALERTHSVDAPRDGDDDLSIESYYLNVLDTLGEYGVPLDQEPLYVQRAQDDYCNSAYTR